MRLPGHTRNFSLQLPRAPKRVSCPYFESTIPPIIPDVRVISMAHLPIFFLVSLHLFCICCFFPLCPFHSVVFVVSCMFAWTLIRTALLTHPDLLSLRWLCLKCTACAVLLHPFDHDPLPTIIKHHLHVGSCGFEHVH